MSQPPSSSHGTCALSAPDHSPTSTTGSFVGIATSLRLRSSAVMCAGRPIRRCCSPRTSLSSSWRCVHLRSSSFSGMTRPAGSPLPISISVAPASAADPREMVPCTILSSSSTSPPTRSVRSRTGPPVWTCPQSREVIHNGNAQTGVCLCVVSPFMLVDNSPLSISASPLRSADLRHLGSASLPQRWVTTLDLRHPPDGSRVRR